MPDVVCDMTLTDSTGTVVGDYTSIPTSQVRHLFNDNTIPGMTIQVVVKEPPDPATPNGPNAQADAQVETPDTSFQHGLTTPIDTTSIPEKTGPGKPPEA
jgi:hypothetical protein